MNYTALDIIHFWSDSRGKLIQKIIPAKGKVYVYCTDNLSGEAVKVCHFLHLIIRQSWTFQITKEDERFVIVFFPEKVTLNNLFKVESQRGETKKPRAKRGNAGVTVI